MSPKDNPKSPSKSKTTKVKKNSSADATSAENPTITQKITTLNEQIAWFYSDDFSLDQALTNYQSAINLATEIQSDLQTLKNQVELISQNFTNQT